MVTGFEGMTLKDMHLALQDIQCDMQTLNDDDYDDQEGYEAYLELQLQHKALWRAIREMESTPDTWLSWEEYIALVYNEPALLYWEIVPGNTISIKLE